MFSNPDAPIFIREIAKTGHDIWSKGWAEANGGNISLRLHPDKLKDAPPFAPKSDWISLHAPLKTLAGEKFLVSGTGRYLRNIELFPEKNTGVIELNGAGDSYRMLWGFEPEGRPTSELEAHLKSHAVIKTVSNNTDHAVIHTHAPNLIALTYRLELNTERLTKLLWRMHAECIVGFPAGIEFIPWMLAGSDEIALATAKALEKRKLAVWQFHGVFGVGRNLDSAFGLIDMAEKAAQIYLTAMSAGGIKACLSDAQLAKIAEKFRVVPDKEAMACDFSG